MPFDLEVLKTSSLLAYPLVFLGGVITSIGPCNVAMIPLIIGYLGGSVDLSRRGSFTLSLTFAGHKGTTGRTAPAVWWCAQVSSWRPGSRAGRASSRPRRRCQSGFPGGWRRAAAGWQKC